MYTTMTIRELARVIQQDWNTTSKKGIYFGALPYLQAMQTMYNIDDKYGFDDGRGIVAYFLANAQTWKGEVAKAVKAELNRRLKNK